MKCVKGCHRELKSATETWVQARHNAEHAGAPIVLFLIVIGLLFVVYVAWVLA